MKKKRWLLLIAMLIAVMMLPLTANAAVKLNKKKVTLTVGKTVQLKVKGTKSKVNWSSTNKNVAVVNKKGKVSAKSAGSATIKATVGKKTLKCKVTVNAPITPAPAPAPTPTPTPAPEPSLSAVKLDLIAGQQKQLTLNNAPGNVAWSSSNHRIAGVDSDGTVYAKFYGACTIKATCGGKSYTCTISVKLPTPKCYPQKGFSFPGHGVEIRFDVFETQFVAYRPITSDVQAVTDDNQYTCFNPFVYKIHLKGNLQTTSGSNAGRQFWCCVTHMWEGQMNDVTDYMTWISLVTDQNGDFELTKEVQLCGPAESIYLALGYIG